MGSELPRRWCNAKNGSAAPAFIRINMSERPLPVSPQLPDIPESPDIPDLMAESGDSTLQMRLQKIDVFVGSANYFGKDIRCRVVA